MTGCSAFTREVVRTETVIVEVPVRAQIPEILLRPCWLDDAAYDTTIEGLAQWAEDLLLTLELCNADKADISALQGDHHQR